MSELYAEFLPCFSHRPFFNINCDETWDLCKGRSAPLAAELGGKEFVYLSHLRRVHQLAAEHGRRACFWADMAEESAGIFSLIPKDMVALHWWYESEGDSAGRDYIERTRPSMREGLEHWVCPGTSGWLSFFFRKDNARGNLRRWARTARESGAVGYLTTDWGDFGHHNCLSYSYWPLAYGADCAWRAEPDSAAEAAFDARFFVPKRCAKPRRSPPLWRAKTASIAASWSASAASGSPACACNPPPADGPSAPWVIPAPATLLNGVRPLQMPPSSSARSGSSAIALRIGPRTNPACWKSPPGAGNEAKTEIAFLLLTIYVAH